MDWRKLPSLNALKAFSALAEAGSYSRAGEFLNVTHAAVMQQVKALETHFGQQLVSRSGRKTELTEEGQNLARELRVGFRRILDGVETLTDVQNTRPIQVTMSPAFAVSWLMPRIADFQSRHPDVMLLLNPSGRLIDLVPGGMDVAIRYSRIENLPEGADVLIKVDLVVVGTPAVVESVAISGPGDLIHLPWLQELGTSEVAEWLARRGVKLDRPIMISHMPGNLILDTVKRGDGITYTVRQWIEEDLRSGDLVALFPEVQVGAFYIHTLTGEQRRSVKVFIKWLKAQVLGDP